jgi:hypothetical protein
LLFQGYVVKVKDSGAFGEGGTMYDHDRHLFDKILKRMNNEHPHVNLTANTYRLIIEIENLQYELKQEDKK